ncbi:MAG TPA: DNA polymerase IV [Xanthomonadales bacterium]|nr:DNA polymerase IV [Xanthomonadales bacterium]
MGEPTRAIVHVDMDAFYASVEQLDHPEWRGLPVIVGSDSRRGVVATASYEARRYGVRSAMPGVTAKRLCPDGIFVAPRMARYAELSRRVFDVLARITPEIESLSLDEAFLDVGASLRLFGSLAAIGTRIKADVLAETGLRCSVGMAHNKLLAKLATELGKPDGLYHLVPARVTETLDPLPVGRLWTVGRVAEERLAVHGIRTIGALRRASPTLLEREFGSHGATMRRLAAGEDDRPVEPERAEQSIGAENTFLDDLVTLDDARAWLMRLTERVGERTRRHGLAGRTVTLKLRVPPFETMTRQAQLATPSAQTGDIYALGDRILSRWWRERDRPALRLLGVSLSGFAAEAPQADLFAAPGRGIDDSLVDRINEKFGGGAIRRATGLKRED